MCFILKFLRLSIRNNCYLILGLLAGVTVSLIAIGLIESNKCIITPKLESISGEFANLIAVDEYEPRINLAGKPLKAKKTPQDFARPRYFSTELSIREKLFVGVLTSPNSLHTYGVALNKTLYNIVNKLIFFSETEPGKQSVIDVSELIQFSDSRLILKPFHVIKYITDTFLDDFDYFYLVRDTTYVNGRKLMEIANSLSVSKDVHLGGKSDSLTSFCTIDGGIFLSSLVLRRVAASLDWCVKNAFSDSDDANVGRCILHATDIPCRQQIDNVGFQAHQLINPDLPIERILKDSGLADSTSVWPIVKPELFFYLHQFYAKREIVKTELEISRLRHAIESTVVVLPGNKTEKPSWPIGTPPPSKPINRFDLLRWDYFTETEIYFKTDFTVVDKLEGADVLDFQNMLEASLQFLEKKYEGQLEYKKLLNGYRKFDPARGMDYVVDLSVRDTVTGQETIKRLEVCKPLGKVEQVPITYVTETTRVNLIVVATINNKEDMLKFINTYATACMEKKERTSLLLILVYGFDDPGKESKNDIFAAVKKEATRQSNRFRKNSYKITWLSVKVPSKSMPPLGLLNILLMDLVIKKFTPENIILWCTPNMDLRIDYLNRVRMNTVQEKQIFSPIPFSEFHPIIAYNEDLPRPKELDINKNYGHYDEFNMEHISFYVRDYKSARKNLERYLPVPHTDKDLSPKFHIEILPLGDTSIYGMFVRYSSIHIMRAVEPSLHLRHVKVNCGANISEICNERRTYNLGTRSQLGRLVLEYLKKGR